MNSTKKYIISSLIFLLMLTMASLSYSQQLSKQPTGFLDRTVVVNGHTHRYQVYVPAEYTAAAKRWPVILFLHGADERGTDGLRQTEVGLGSAVRRHPERYPAIIVFPQAPQSTAWAVDSTARIALAALEQTQSEFSTDSSRLYLTGISMGGAGSWHIAYNNPNKFAAIVPICGWVGPKERWPQEVVPADSGQHAKVLASKIGALPVWVWHGDADKDVSVERSRAVVEALKSLGNNVRYSELPSVGHNSWDAAYRSVELPTWLFEQKR